MTYQREYERVACSAMDYFEASLARHRETKGKIEAIAEAAGEPSPKHILPTAFDRSVAPAVALRVAEAARQSGVCAD